MAIDDGGEVSAQGGLEAAALRFVQRTSYRGILVSEAHPTWALAAGEDAAALAEAIRAGAQEVIDRELRRVGGLLDALESRSSGGTVPEPRAQALTVDEYIHLAMDCGMSESEARLHLADSGILSVSPAPLMDVVYRDTDPRAAMHAMSRPAQPQPIDMMLPCPLCKTLHVDAPEPVRGWTNPPHRSHLCARCGCVWRPADVPTNGVAEVRTRGKADTWPTSGAPPLGDTPEEIAEARERFRCWYGISLEGEVHFFVGRAETGAEARVMAEHYRAVADACVSRAAELDQAQGRGSWAQPWSDDGLRGAFALCEGIFRVGRGGEFFPPGPTIVCSACNRHSVRANHYCPGEVL